MPSTEAHESTGTRRQHANPLSLFIATIREAPVKANEHKHKNAFRELLFEPEYEDFLKAVVEEWISIKYSTARDAAKPVTAEDIRTQHQAKKNAAADLQDKVNKASQQIKGRALQLVMPNGKRLSECTGAECCKFGGWFTKIGEKIGKRAIVGEALTEKELLEIL
jgi:hypothetical protein